MPHTPSTLGLGPHSDDWSSPLLDQVPDKKSRGRVGDGRVMSLKSESDCHQAKRVSARQSILCCYSKIADEDIEPETPDPADSLGNLDEDRFQGLSTILVEYDPAWPLLYASERKLLAAHLGDFAAGIQHIGSTSVPGLLAKPIIDILVESRVVIPPTDSFIRAINSAGYTIAYAADAKRAQFVKGSPRVNCWVYWEGDDTCSRLQLFPMYLRMHPERSVAYGALKQHLASRYPLDSDQYTREKLPFVNETVELARAEFGDFPKAV